MLNVSPPEPVLTSAPITAPPTANGVANARLFAIVSTVALAPFSIFICADKSAVRPFHCNVPLPAKSIVFVPSAAGVVIETVPA